MSPTEIANLITEDISVNNDNDSDSEIIRKGLVYLRNKLVDIEAALTINNMESPRGDKFVILQKIYSFVVK